MRRKSLLFCMAFCLILSGCSKKAAEESYMPQADSTVVDTLATNVDLNTQTPAGKKFIKTAELKFRVKNVLSATEKIEDISSKYDGYLTYSNLQNETDNQSTSNISRDSTLVTKQIVVVNNIKLRIPNERLDSFIRELNILVDFLDYRVIKLSDVTYQQMAGQMKAKRLHTYEKRQTNHIDQKSAKLKETSVAEDNLLDRQNQADDLKVGSLALEDQIKYCDLIIDIYQKPVIVKETVARFDYVSDSKPGFFRRILDSLVQGWSILEESIVFLVNIWGLLLLGVALVFGFKYLKRWYNRMND